MRASRIGARVLLALGALGWVSCSGSFHPRDRITTQLLDRVAASGVRVEISIRSPEGDRIITPRTPQAGSTRLSFELSTTGCSAAFESRPPASLDPALAEKLCADWADPFLASGELDLAANSLARGVSAVLREKSLLVDARPLPPLPYPNPRGGLGAAAGWPTGTFLCVSVFVLATLVRGFASRSERHD